jgi:hypothetical protein
VATVTEWGTDRKVTHLVKLRDGTVIEPDYVNVTDQGWLNYSYEAEERVDADKTWFRLPPHRVEQWEKAIHGGED